MDILTLDEIRTVARASDEVDESKSARQHRFRFKSGEDAGPYSGANKKWTDQLREFQPSNSYEELCGIDGEPIESEWKISHDLRHWKSSEGPKRMCKIKRLIQNILKGESSSCQCSMTSVGRRKKIQKQVFRIPNKSRTTQKGSRVDVGHSSAQETKKNDTGSTPTNLKENGTPSLKEEAAGNSWRGHLQRFKMLDPGEQFRTLFESAGFMRPVSVALRCRTSDDVKDGFGNRTGSCRECTLLRTHQNSVVKLRIKKDTQRSDQFLKSRLSVTLTFMESKFRSPLHLEMTPMFWVVISRGSNRYVDPLRYKDPEYSPGSLEEADHGSMQETDAEQPTIQSGFNSVCSIGRPRSYSRKEMGRHHCR